MTKTEDDLWPENFTEPHGERPPLVVLREQAGLLGKKTQNLVKAEVRADPSPRGGLLLRFLLVAPALHNYQYQLFTARQPDDFYPVDIETDDKDVRRSWKGEVKWENDQALAAKERQKDKQPGRPFRIGSEKELKDLLRAILGSDTTKRVLSGLLLQSKSA